MERGGNDGTVKNAEMQRNVNNSASFLELQTAVFIMVVGIVANLMYSRHYHENKSERSTMECQCRLKTEERM